LNPLKLLKTMSEIVGASKGGDILAKPLAITGQLLGALKGNPSVFLKNAFSASGPGAEGQLTNVTTKAVASTINKGAEAAGKGLGNATSGVLSGAGALLMPIPVVGQVAGMALDHAGKLANHTIQILSKVAGKVAGQLVSALAKTIVRHALPKICAQLKLGIQRAMKRGNCKAVFRKRVHLGSKRPAIINPGNLALRIANQLRAGLRELQGGALHASLHRTAPGSPRNKSGRIAAFKGAITNLQGRIQALQAKLGHTKKLLAPARFMLRSGQSLTKAGQGGASSILGLSNSAQHFGKGDVSQAASSLGASATALKGATGQMAAPAREGIGRAWRGRAAVMQPFGKAMSRVSRGRMDFSRVKATLQHSATVSRPGRLFHSATAKANQMGRTLAQPFQAMASAVKPYTLVAKRVAKIASAPIRATKAAGSVLADGARMVQSAGQAPLALARGTKAFGAEGDASAAISSLHQAGSHLSSLPDGMQSTLAHMRQFRGPSAPHDALHPASSQTGDPASQLPPHPSEPSSNDLGSPTPGHMSRSGKLLWS
jgi:hypothetical protein